MKPFIPIISLIPHYSCVRSQGRRKGKLLSRKVREVLSQAASLPCALLQVPLPLGSPLSCLALAPCGRQMSQAHPKSKASRRPLFKSCDLIGSP